LILVLLILSLFQVTLWADDQTDLQKYKQKKQVIIKEHNELAQKRQELSIRMNQLVGKVEVYDSLIKYISEKEVKNETSEKLED